MTVPSPPVGLGAIQAATIDALYGALPCGALLENIKAPSAITALDALAIYRNATRGTLVNALQLTYRVTERLVGAAFFAAAAGCYAESEASRSGDLERYGSGFPSFLATYGPARHLPYLSEVARFEWLLHEALRAPAAMPLTLELLQRLGPEEAAGLRYPLVPRSGLFVSRFPAARIWESHRRDLTDPDFAEVDATGDRVLLVAIDTPRLVTVSAAQSGFYEALQTGRTLDESVQAALIIDRDFDLQVTLEDAIRLQVLAAPAVGPLRASGTSKPD